MSENPFAAPQSSSIKQPIKYDPSLDYQHDGSGRGYVRQIGVVSILIIIQGVLLLLFGLFCVGYAFFFQNLSSFMSFQERAQFEAQLPPEQVNIIVWLLRGYAIATLPMAILYIVTGIFNFGFRGRALGIITLILGISSALTCYCAVTAIPLSIYGLIIYFNPAVSEAFRMRKSGITKQQVLASFVR